MYNNYINHERIYMNKNDEVLETIILSGKFIVDEDDTSYDDAINELIEKDLIKWSDSEDDALVLVNPIS